ncbi:tRNA-specific adenosine deaminase 2 [Nosema bombycis CQ1]|uniref:tRNA-specific adenosine deaminase 2 n=1 Tax=Nosema bombycis (strain CQ1 / CVCC 102059) TaxID=578461 RepID=R0MCR5_NOSB1|nr:tRNA-specific adenosine deaminase 2 [Nosema bombycis CQ1]|eukprot:EOB11825.1 tRNA-specific adenosine deaminase 2 [Nosema bombycis CQ1]
MHKIFLEEAYKEAIKALQEQEVPVGCVIVQNKQILSRSHNLTNKLHDPLAHAEINGLRELLQQSQITDDLTFYITCEPCIMCLGILNRIKARIYYGCKNIIFGGITILETPSDSHFIEDKRCYEILQKFYSNENEFAPEEKRKKKNNRNNGVPL